MNAMTDPHTAPVSASPTCTHPPSAKAAGSSFYWAMRLLPADRRDAMFHVYAFCREVDDIADGVDPADVKMVRLEEWRGRVESLYRDDDPMPEIQCLKPVVTRYGLDKADLIAIVDGMEMDAHDVVRIADETAFDLYLDRVASAVGRLSDKVFGLAGDVSVRLAHHLGRALQITNILRDLDEDARRNRLYLPLSLLKAHGIDSDDPAQVLSHANLGTVLNQLAGQAHEHFTEAKAIMARLEKAKTRPARVMMAVYARLLERLEARGLARINVAVKLSKFEKLWLAVRHGIL